tara:strand:+ start:741 stop:875 length:135 start_codon:yes stop_codon:yes gene_type:complete
MAAVFSSSRIRFEGGKDSLIVGLPPTRARGAGERLLMEIQKIRM